MSINRRFIEFLRFRIDFYFPHKKVVIMKAFGANNNWTINYFLNLRHLINFVAVVYSLKKIFQMEGPRSAEVVIKLFTFYSSSLSSKPDGL